jgi:hypothetical protein
MFLHGNGIDPGNDGCLLIPVGPGVMTMSSLTAGVIRTFLPLFRLGKSCWKVSLWAVHHATAQRYIKTLLLLNIALLDGAFHRGSLFS